jgi:putative membrane protein
MFVLLGAYLFVYPFGILLIALDIVPSWGTWMGGALLIVQGSIMGLWLTLNYRWRGALAVLFILLISWAIEHIGVTTGFPFGGYHYTDTLNLKVFGVVPLAVPFAWLMVVPAALGIAEYVICKEEGGVLRVLVGAWRHAATRSAHGSFQSRWSRFIEALASDDAPAQAGPPDTTPMTGRQLSRTLLDMLVRVLGAASFAMLLDLLIEPLAVPINGYWVWDHTGSGYYDVPGSNFIAWWVTSAFLAALTTFLVYPLLRGHTGEWHTRATPSYHWLPALLYILNLMMFVLIFLAHGKLLALTVGVLVLCFLAIARLEPRLIGWIMGSMQHTKPLGFIEHTGGKHK